MERVKRYIYSQVASKQLSKADALIMLTEIFKSASQKPTLNTEVAIVGMACRFPGAKNMEEFWRVLAGASDCIDDFPETRRQDIDRFYSPGFGSFKRGGYLEAIDKFDAAFFRLSPKEAELMDPAQRLFLETAFEAIEDAGLGGEKLRGSKTGIYVGKETTGGSGYTNNLTDLDFASTGATTSIIASRLAYILDLEGPALVVDTACSSSLVALHIATKALLNEEIDTAIVGGANLMFLPVGGSSLIDSFNDRIASFAKDADGTVWGEGIGAVVLKPLRKALMDKNHIYAVIKGSAINNDGASNGLTAPSAEAQMKLLREAWKSAGISPETISYIEAHGTGTKLGDPIEIKGITMAFERYTHKKQFCGIGAVKTNIGHLVGAAGIASVIKMALALKHRQLPATLNFSGPNPLIDFLESPVYVNEELASWNTESFPRRCGISSFGFSGTNCHVILEEAPATGSEPQGSRQGHIFTLSVKDQSRLPEMIRRYNEYLAKGPEPDLEALCYTVNTGRAHYNCRLAIIAVNTTELARKLRKIAGMELEAIHQAEADICYGRHIVVFNKKEKTAGELSEEEKIRLSTMAGAKIKELTGDYQHDHPLLREICKFYIAGAEIPWPEIYPNNSFKTLSLPTYPFKPDRHWAKFDQELNAAPIQNKGTKEINHLLLDHCRVKTFNECIFETEFSVEKQWVLSEHKITGKSVIPGTTYLEMITRAGQEYFQRKVTGLENVQFYSPLVFNEAAVKNVQTIIKVDDGLITFTTVSCADENRAYDPAQWTIHATGELSLDEPSAGKHYDLNLLLQRFGPEIEVSIQEDTGMMTFGPHWRMGARARLGDGAALVYLEMLPEFMAEVADFTLHPALLDIATSIGSSQIVENDLPYLPFLPFAYQKMTIYGPIPGRCYSYIHPFIRQESHELIKYQVEILDETGKLVVEIQDFTMKRVKDIQGTIQELAGKNEFYFTTAWIPEPVKPKAAPDRGGGILIFGDDKGISETLAAHFAKQGRAVVLVELGPEFKQIANDKYQINGSQVDYERLLVEIKHIDPALVLHLQTIGGPDASSGIESLREQQKRGIYSLFYFIRAISKNKIRNDLQIVLIAEYANEVTGTEPRLHPANAALFGLGKAAGQESTNLRLRALDIDENISIEQIIKELHTDIPAYQVAYRNGRRYVEVLKKASLSGQNQTGIPVKSDGVYLLTGGTGGIGLEIGKYLATKASVNLALINRTRLPERTEWDTIISGAENPKLRNKIMNLKEMENAGAVVGCYSADVANLEEMEALIAELRKKYGKINGIIHSAGVAGDGFMIRKAEAAFTEVLAPKVTGTWIMDQLTRDDELDFFILFSSIASLFGGAGQGDYMAANSYLDTFAFHRNKTGKRTIAINWPAWKETGMAVDYGANDDTFFKALHTGDGIRVFGEILQSNLTRVIVGELNYQDEALFQQDQKMIKLAPEIMADLENRKKKHVIRKTGADLSALDYEVVIHGTKDAELSETQKQLAQVWANSLGLKEISIFDDFYGLGGDSILAIKIVNEIKAVLGKKIDIGDLFEHPTISELAACLDGQVITVPDTVNQNQPENTATEKEYELSSLQKRIWFLQKYDPGMTAYNLPGKIVINQPLDLEKLTRAVNYLIRRHEALRIIFREKDGTPKQVILKEYNLAIQLEDLSTNEEQENLLNRLIQVEDSIAFEMTKPLLMMKVFKLAGAKYCVYYNMHHIILDGWSSEIFIQELVAVYRSYSEGKEPDLAPLKRCYSDWLEMQQEWQNTSEAQTAREYWLAELAKPLPSLELPVDFKRPDLQTFNGRHLPVKIEKEDLDKLKQGAKQGNATLNMVLLAVYFLFLQKTTGDQDIILGMPLAGRDDQDFEKVIGLFINTVCIRVKFQNLNSFNDLLQYVKEKSLSAFKNGKFPFDLLVNLINPERIPGKSPIFSTMFQFYDNIPQENENVSKFELNFLCQEIAGEIVGRLEYNTDLFAKATIERFRNSFLAIVKMIGANPTQPLHEINLIKEADKQKIIRSFNEDLESE